MAFQDWYSWNAILRLCTIKAAFMRCKLFIMRGNCGQGYVLKWVMLGDELGNIADDGIVSDGAYLIFVTRLRQCVSHG